MKDTVLFIVNFSGQASPARLQHLAQVTHSHEGTWLTSKINYLDEQVAGLIKLQCPTDSVDVIQRAFNEIEELHVQFAQSEITQHDEDDVYELRFDSQERSGIIQDISLILEREQAKILSIDTDRIFLADTQGVNATLFSSRFSITLPEQTNINDVIAELKAIACGVRIIDLTDTTCK
ncbi:MAG: ACT domain-containing protein [Vibrio sp.]